MDDIRGKLQAFITDNFLFGRLDGAISDDDSLVEGGVVDSTGVLSLVGFLEQSFGVRVQDDEIVPENLDSINRLVAYISRKQEAAHNAGHAGGIGEPALGPLEAVASAHV